MHLLGVVEDGVLLGAWVGWEDGRGEGCWERPEGEAWHGPSGGGSCRLTACMHYTTSNPKL